MITDLEIAIHKTGDTGQGGTEEQPDGTWLAWVFLDTDDAGLYGAGASERHALKALESKLKALGGIMASAYAEAESRQRVRADAEAAAFAKKLEGLLEGLGGLEGLDEPTPKKPQGDN
jgi:hypothetical protein